MESNDEFIRKATAHLHGGAGQHGDKRKKRRRTRDAEHRHQIEYQKEE